MWNSMGVFITLPAGLEMSRTGWNNSHLRRRRKTQALVKAWAYAAAICIFNDVWLTLTGNIHICLFRQYVHWQTSNCIRFTSTCQGSLIPIWQYPNSHAFSCFYVHVTDLICATKIWGGSLKSCSVNPAFLHLALTCMLVIGLQSDSSWQLKSIGLNTLKTQNVIQSAKKFPKVERMHRDRIEKLGNAHLSVHTQHLWGRKSAKLYKRESY